MVFFWRPSTSIEQLNERLRAAAEADLHRRITGKENLVAEDFAHEKQFMLALPPSPLILPSKAR